MPGVQSGTRAYFSPELFHSNHRAWFQANKQRHEALVRQPFLRYIEESAPRLERISPYYVAGPPRLLEPDNCFLGPGVWMPEAENLRRVRAAIGPQDYLWLGLRKALEDDGEGQLSRPSKGYRPDHFLIKNLEQRSFTVSYQLNEQEVLSEKLPDTVEKVFCGLLR